MKKIKLADGIEVTTFAPAADFNPLTASAAALVANGFPHMPDDPQQRERYARLWGRIKNRFSYVEPTFRVNSDRFHGPRKRQPDAMEKSGNWSGGVVYAPKGQAFKWVEGDWTVPSVAAPTNPITGRPVPGWYYCASWIGIDGDGSFDVLQAGVECEVFQSGTAITHVIYPWWEWAPAPEYQITNLTFSPGDHVSMLICSAAGPGSTTATVYFYNLTTGASTSFSPTAPADTKLVGNSAEWIVERPSIGGVLTELADYGEILFSNCEAFTDNATVDGATGDNIDMIASWGLCSSSSLIPPTMIRCDYQPDPGKN